MKNNVKIIPWELKSEEDAKKLVDECDADFDRAIDSLAERVSDARGVRIIKLAGPTCAGKTTASRKIMKSLEKKNIQSALVSVDSFFYDREYLHAMSQKKGGGELDYDSPDTINYASLEKFVKELLEKGCAECPVFDFESGSAQERETVSLSRGGVLIIEGIQVFYPQISEILKGMRCISVYISALSDLSFGDVIFEKEEIRLMRRLVRDNHFRATPPEKTLELWRGVRRNEDKNIFPFIDSADVLLDSSMKYEISVLKIYLEDILRGISDARALSVLEKIAPVYNISSEYIGADSLYREFV